MKPDFFNTMLSNMDSFSQKANMKEKPFVSPHAPGLPVYCFRLYKDLVRMMSMHVRDERVQDIFYSLLTGTDISELSDRYNLSMRELIFMYAKGVREVSRCWNSMVQEQQSLQSVNLRYRNCKAVLHRSNLACEQFKVLIPLKECDIPAECMDKLSTPLEYLEIQPRVLRNLRKYNIYLLEDLLRFIKKNGFDALGKLHGIGVKSCEGLYRTLRNKDILKSKDTCDLFRYIFI